MKSSIIFALLFTVLYPTMSKAQELQNFKAERWQHRILLFLSETEDSPILREQIELLNTEMTGLRERKLKVYTLLPEGYKETMSEGRIQPGATLYENYSKNQFPFELVLIGLDGSIKLRQSDPINSEDLFALIDGMPMRKQELLNDINLEK